MAHRSRQVSDSEAALYKRGAFFRATEPVTYSEWKAYNFPTPVNRADLNAENLLSKVIFTNLTGKDASFRTTHVSAINPVQGIFADNFVKIDEYNVPAGTSVVASFLPDAYILSLSQQRIDANGRPYYLSSIGKKLDEVQGSTSIISSTSNTPGQLNWITASDPQQVRTIIKNNTNYVINATLSKVATLSHQSLSECNAAKYKNSYMIDYGASVLSEQLVDPHSTLVLRVPEQTQRVFVMDPNVNEDPSTGQIMYCDFSNDKAYDQEANGVFGSFMVCAAVLASDGSGATQLIIKPTNTVTLVDANIVVESPNGTYTQ